MPYGDGTGPNGLGPLTGKRFGPCGRGLGRRFPYREQVTLTKTEEKKILEAELKEIETEKKEIEKRLEEMD